MTTIKQHDTLDSLTGTCNDGSDNGLIGISSLYILARIQGSTDILFWGECDIIDDAAGTWRYDWADDDNACAAVAATTASPKTWVLEIELEGLTAEGKRVTWPSDGYSTVTIVDDIGDAPLDDAMASPTTVIDETTEDINRDVIGLLPLGMKLTLYLEDEAMQSTVVAADGTWSLAPRNDATYTLKGIKADDVRTWTVSV